MYILYSLKKRSFSFALQTNICSKLTKEALEKGEICLKVTIKTPERYH